MKSQTNHKHTLQIIARNFALNHYNISVTESDNTKLNSAIFNSESVIADSNGEFPKRAIYSRNILIVGSKASEKADKRLKNAFDTILSVEEAIGLYNRIGVNYKYPMNESPTYALLELNETTNEQDRRIIQDRAKYAHEVSILMGTVVEPELIHEFFSSNRDFEKRLQLLMTLYKPSIVWKTIHSYVSSKYISYLFYEIVAHLLKHRFLDVVIDTNFDEILYNTIEDELGESDYKKIISRDDIENFSDIHDKCRLRVPIYIKPHGTISRYKSLQFTHSHYANQSPEMRSLIKSIFRGETGDKSKPLGIKTLNFYVVGHSLRDDVGEVLREVIMDNSKQDRMKWEINIFSWSEGNPAAKVIQLLASKDIKPEHNYSYYEKKFLDDSANQEASKLFSKEYKTSIYKLKSAKYSSDFKYIYKQIQEAFKTPYTPRGIQRHEFLSLALSWIQEHSIPKEIEKLPKADKDKFIQKKLIYGQFCAHLIYDYYKFNPVIPEQEMFKGRSAKYLRLYLKMMSKEPGSIKIHRDLLSKFATDVTHVDGCHFICSKREQDADLGVEILCQNIYDGPFEEKLDKKDKASLKSKLEDCRKNVSPALEINLNQFSYNSFVFKQLKSDNHIYTNLGLSWRFFNRAIETLNRNNYDEIWLSSRTGGPLVNLALDADGSDNYLKYLKGKKIRLILRDASSQVKSLSIKLSTLEFIQRELNNQCEIDYLVGHTSHQIALFVKRKGNKITPLSAIYYYLPESSNRISPIFLDSKNKENLEWVQQAFNDDWDKLNSLLNKNSALAPS